MSKRFCPRGHDTWQTGRYKSYRCAVCTKADVRAREQRGERTVPSEESKRKARVREKVWRQARPKVVRLYNQRHRAKPETQRREKSYRQQWWSKNRNYANYKQRLRRTGLTSSLAAGLVNYYGPTCVYCGGDASGFDHLTPVSQEGANVFENLAPCCQGCNRRKGARPIWTVLLPREVKSTPCLT